MKTEIMANGVVLYCGDCREILPSLPKVSAFVSDVPYGVAFATQRGFSSWDGQQIAGDHTTEARDGALALCQWDGAIVFGSWKVPRPVDTRAVLIWDKGDAVGMGDLSLPWKPNHEEIYVLGSGFAGHRGSGVLRGHTSISWESNGRSHPNAKPVSLMVDLIRKVSGPSILDPFMGCGPTGVAAVQLGLQFTGIEIEPKYYDIARQRIEDALKAPGLFTPRESARPAQSELL